MEDAGTHLMTHQKKRQHHLPSPVYQSTCHAISLSPLHSLYEPLYVLRLALKTNDSNFSCSTKHRLRGALLSLTIHLSVLRTDLQPHDGETSTSVNSLHIRNTSREVPYRQTQKNRRKKKVGGKSWRVAASQLTDWRDAVVAKTRQIEYPSL